MAIDVRFRPVRLRCEAGRQGAGLGTLGRLARHRMAFAALVVLAVVVLLAYGAAAFPALERHHPHAQQYERVHSGPTADHFLGTDQLGRDLWARAWEGTRIALTVGLGTQVLVLVVGVAVGTGAVLAGRTGDGILMRFTDLVFAFPDLLGVILLRAVLSERGWPIAGSGEPQLPGLPGTLLQVIVAIGFVSWVTLARLVRGQLLATRELDYVVAARALGASERRVVFRHMLPATTGTVIVALSFGIPAAIFAEATLAFIGLGVPPPSASLGTLVLDGYTSYRANPWMLGVPCATLALLMLCFAFLGEGLREACDPRSRR
jgi:oligopeptide transport system permease protein